MRVVLTEGERNSYFSSLKIKANKSWQEIAKDLAVNGRMLRFWRSGELTIPRELFDKIENFYAIGIPSKAKFLEKYWHIKEASRKGGFARYAKYGSLGTIEGRRKGGINSLKSPKLRLTNFKFRKVIKVPRKSRDLAKLFGIVIGDGGITRFQVKVTLGLKHDKEYAFFVKSFIEKLFALGASVIETRSDSTIEVVVSSRALVEFLVKHGLHLGNKINQGLNIPAWIKKNHKWSLSCVRGIFDTDGSVYIDWHKGKSRIYKSINLALTSASDELLLSITNILVKEGFNPTITSKGSVRLRRSKDVKRFFEVIGSDNFKHLGRFRRFLGKEEYPSGHTGTVSKTVGVARPT